MQLRVAVADPPQAEHDLGAAHVGRRAEQVVDRELHPRHRLAAMDRQQQREAEALAPAVEAAHQVDRLALVVRVARVELVERVGDDERVVRPARVPARPRRRGARPSRARARRARARSRRRRSRRGPTSRSRRLTVRKPCSASSTSTRPPAALPVEEVVAVTIARTICSANVVFPSPVWAPSTSRCPRSSSGPSSCSSSGGSGSAQNSRALSTSSTASGRPAAATSSANCSRSPGQSHQSPPSTGGRSRTAALPMIPATFAAPLSPASSAS